jgi:hypothetical protein
MKFLRNRYFLTGLVVIQALFTLLIKPPKEKILVSDAVHYHSWLSSAFIQKDLSLSFLEPNRNYDIQYAHNVTEDGKAVFKMPHGVALLQMPFFLAAHAIVLTTDQPADGYSNTYQLAIRLAGIFYFILGIIFLRHYLRKRFDEAAVNLTLAVFSIGSNLYYYAFMESGMSHVYTFSLLSVMIWLFDKEKIRFQETLLIGVLSGMLFLVRNSNVLLLLYFPLLQFVGKSVKSNFFIKPRLIIAAAIPALVLVLTQLIYIHWATNHWMLSAYHRRAIFLDSSRSCSNFYFLSRKAGLFILHSCFSSSLVCGYVPQAGRGKPAHLIITLVLCVYVFSAWWCWWYGGSFGMRAMIDLYALLVLPIAHAMQWIIRRKAQMRNFALGILTIGIILNIFQTYQYQHAIIHWDGMSAELYKVDTFSELKRHPDYPGLNAPNYELFET